MGKITSWCEPGERYSALRIIGPLFTLFGLLLLAIGSVLLALAVYALLDGSAGTLPAKPEPFMVATSGDPSLITRLGAGLFLLWATALLISGLQFVALGTGVRLLIHMEENTRASALALDKIRASLEPRRGGAEPFFVS